MSLDKIVKWLMPKEERFHELLALDTANLVKAARLFKEIADGTNLEERRVKSVMLKAVEHDGDTLTRQVFEALNSTFITPLDREDIRSIAMDIDDILDYLEAVSQSLILFELAESPTVLRQFADILVAMSEAIDKATSMVWDLANEKKIGDAIVRISELENQADQLYNAVIADLFRGHAQDAIYILKWKEIYQQLEDACDACKDYTHILGNVVIKNA
jgi:predicted phosphate transport protein (TIGR00153 family)